MENILKIGKKCFLVHRSYAYKKKSGGQILIGRLKTWKNIQGKVTPIFVEVGFPKIELTLKNYIPFLEEQKAIDSIKS